MSIAASACGGSGKTRGHKLRHSVSRDRGSLPISAGIMCRSVSQV